VSSLRIERHVDQLRLWPSTGRVILAQFDEGSVVVYQAYRPSIGRFAAKNGFFGGEFSMSRMSWVKPNFLWMMYRCGWGTKQDQEVVLAVRIRRAAFDGLLADAVHSAFDPTVHASVDEWRCRVAESDVRLQWDPDHDPQGRPLERRAIQLGLRGKVLAHYAREWIASVEDVSAFVSEQREQLAREPGALSIPAERPYPVTDPQVVRRLGLTAAPPDNLIK
jgi:hypothetical protein